MSFTNKYFGKYVKTIDQFLGITNIPIFDLTYRENHGLVAIQPSQYLFDINRKIELFLDSINLHNLRIRRIIKGIKGAAKEKKMIHIWAHPYNFRTEKDFLKLRQIFMAVSEEVAKGRMQSVGMAEMAKLLVNRNTV